MSHKSSMVIRLDLEKVSIVMLTQNYDKNLLHSTRKSVFNHYAGLRFFHIHL